jgi:hypothetical protein
MKEVLDEVLRKEGGPYRKGGGGCRRLKEVEGGRRKVSGTMQQVPPYLNLQGP